MKPKHHFRLTPVLLASLVILAPLHAADKFYLAKGQVDPIALLAPPPAPNSAEQTADLNSVIAVHKSAPKNEIAEAHAQRRIYIFTFAPLVGDFFQSNSLPRTAVFFQRLHFEVQRAVDEGKEFWKRPRPFQLEPALAIGELERTFSYPSGHSTKATVYAAVLAEIFPEKRADILAFGRLMGWHRVQIGRHYPTDVYAGRVLGQAILRELKKGSEFRKDLAEVKKEIAGAQSKAGRDIGERSSAAP